MPLRIRSQNRPEDTQDPAMMLDGMPWDGHSGTCAFTKPAAASILLRGAVGRAAICLNAECDSSVKGVTKDQVHVM